MVLGAETRRFPQSFLIRGFAEVVNPNEKEGKRDFCFNRAARRSGPPLWYKIEFFFLSFFLFFRKFSPGERPSHNVLIVSNGKCLLRSESHSLFQLVEGIVPERISRTAKN